MILAVDSSALTLLVNPGANPPIDPATGAPTKLARERVEFLIGSLRANDVLIVATPVLAEVLVRAEEGAPGIIDQLTGLARIRVHSFGERAAIETAAMTRAAILDGDKRGGSTEAWQKVKFDRQIIAIARVASANRIYADDAGLVAFARRLGMEAISTWELPIPDAEGNLFTVSGLPHDGVGPAAPDTGPAMVTPERPSRAINLGDGDASSP